MKERKKLLIYVLCKFIRKIYSDHAQIDMQIDMQIDRIAEQIEVIEETLSRRRVRSKTAGRDDSRPMLVVSNNSINSNAIPIDQRHSESSTDIMSSQLINAIQRRLSL